MNADVSDHELLRAFAREGAQAAFTAIVNRHLGLVYSVARRHLRSPQLAEDVAQSVFIDLARNARRIDSGTPLVAWLHVVSRRNAIDVVRREARRRARERAAVETSIAEFADLMKPSSVGWSSVEPLLDEAVEALKPADRAAILLRYFENKSLCEVGTAMGTTADAAQKRVTRALDRMRLFFNRRGIAITSNGLATDLSAHATAIPPPALGQSIASAAAAVTPAAVSFFGLFAVGAVQNAVLSSICVVAVGTAMFQVNSVRVQRLEAGALHHRLDEISSRISQTRRDLDSALKETAELNERLASRQNSRPTVGASEMAAQMSKWLERAARLKELRNTRTDLVVPELHLLPDERWMEFARDVRIDSEAQIVDAFSRLRYTAEAAFVGKLQRALRKYVGAHEGRLPDDMHQLAPLLDSPVPGEVLDRYKMLVTGRYADIPPNQRTALAEMNTPLDPVRDTILRFGIDGISTRPAASALITKAIEQFRQANGGVRPMRPEQIQQYLPIAIPVEKIAPYLPPLR